MENNHHEKKQGKQIPVNLKVVSYWTHKNTEYRLVDKQSLQYISAPNNLIQHNNTNNNNSVSNNNNTI